MYTERSMFLALNEIRRDKARFILIVAVIALVSYLTYFLTALAYGLATSYTQGIEKWDADGIILQKDANSNLGRSRMSGDQFDAVRATEKAALGSSLSVVEIKDEKTDIAIFGINPGSFLSPSLKEGAGLKEKRDVIVDIYLKEGLPLGSTFTLFGDSLEYTVVGFTERATYQTVPLIYMSLDDWREQAANSAGMIGMRDNSTISAVVVRGTNEPPLDSVNVSDDSLEKQLIIDFAFTLPGYQAQVITFGTMIGFLIFIASFVLAIFIYILTLQKKSMFGILKAEGVPNKYISRSVKAQIVILSLIGMAIGLVLTLITGWALEGSIPFLVQPLFFAGITVLFLLCAAIGGIASVWAVTKIDPIEAIG